MTRFTSFNYAPGETRTFLRERFARRLDGWHHRRILGPDAQVISDEMTLRLMRGLTIGVEADWNRAREIYAAASPSAAEPKDLEALAQAGWVRKLFGRVQTTSDVRLAARRTSDGSLDAFKALLGQLFEKTYRLTGAARSDPRLAGLGGSDPAGTPDPGAIVCRTPEWVAGRLWEDRTGQTESDLVNLREWMDKWIVLQSGTFVPGDVWSPEHAEAFREAALAVLATDPGLAGWTETRASYIRNIALAHGISIDCAGSGFPEVPKTLVERALWFDDNRIERSFHDSYESCEEIFKLVRLLLADTVAESRAAAPHPMLTKLADLATERAELFSAVLQQTRDHPVLLADLLLRPSTAAVACLLVARWRTPTGGFDRILAERDNAFARNEAFLDAAALLGEFLRDGRTPPPEAAALLKWFHAKPTTGFIDDVWDDEMLKALRRELSDAPKDVHLAMIGSLAGEGKRNGPGTPGFAALLDLVNLGGLEDAIEPEPIVEAYNEAVHAGAYGLTAHRIGAGAAASLFRLASRRSDLRASFLAPPDIGSRLAAEAADNPYSLADSLARSVRAHIRVLSRAVIGLRRDIPDELVGALAATVRAGALEHKEKRRIAAFAPRQEQNGGSDRDRPLAADLGAALKSLDERHREELLTAILETDEPLILAQLCSYTPPSLRQPIQRRIDTLTPADAAGILSLPEMQARIDALLLVGAADAAAAYMDAELALKTLGNAPGRDLARFRNRLHLLYLRREWSEIAATPPPSLKDRSDQVAAEETLNHFAGLAALGRTPADAAGAKEIFKHLFDRRPDFSSALNWFAAECSRLLPADSFGALTGEALRAGRLALEEFERMLEVIPASRKTEEAAECNKALLLLALGEPLQALAVASAAPLVRLHDTAAAYKAVAQSRLGQRTEAIATLDAAAHELGNTPFIRAAREQIGSAASFYIAPAVSFEEDLLRNISAAISRFRNMNPEAQARALNPGTDALADTIIGDVRAAAGSVASLVPMMKGVQIDLIEDDLTAFIQHMLLARVHMLGWTVPDQSKGGFTSNGNPGERDLLLMWGSTTLALLEAVVCDRPLTRDSMKADLESHFQKLFAYSDAPLLFHLTYSYLDDPAPLTHELELIAETTAPTGFHFRSLEPLPRTDSRPPGFTARYDSGSGEVRVVFLVLDLKQLKRREAAKKANATSARKSPRLPKTKP